MEGRGEITEVKEHSKKTGVEVKSQIRACFFFAFHLFSPFLSVFAW
jgi:hypothetical protein